MKIKLGIYIAIILILLSNSGCSIRSFYYPTHGPIKWDVKDGKNCFYNKTPWFEPKLLCHEALVKDSFEKITYPNVTYAKDKYHVYWLTSEMHIVEGADPETFEHVSGLFLRDKNAIYYKGRMLDGADLDTFKPQYSESYHKTEKLRQGSKWASDKTYLYWYGTLGHSKVKLRDPETFVLLDLFWAKDSKAYYRGSCPEKRVKVMDVDYDTFEILDWHYSKDKNNVYYKCDILPDADPGTFEFNPAYGWETKDCCHFWSADKLVDEWKYGVSE